MVRESNYALLQVGETVDRDPENVDIGSTSNDEHTGSTRGGVTKFAKPLAVLLLLGMAVGIYSVANSPSGVAGVQPSDKEYGEANENLFYEVAEDLGGSTPPPESATVTGVLSIEVANPDQFASDQAALEAVTKTVAEIAGVPVSAIEDVKMVNVDGIVKADFTINVPADQADQVADKIKNSTPESDSAILSEKLDDAGISATYPDAKVTNAEAEVPTPAPTPAPTPGPTPTPTPGCTDTPSDWKSSSGSTCADYVSKAYCTADGGYGSGWDDSSTFDDWAVNGVAADDACCGCGGGSTSTTNPCDTTGGPNPAPTPVNPCITTAAPTPPPTPAPVNPCITTPGPNPCATTPAPTFFGRLVR